MTYQPVRSPIGAITQSNPAIVTTTIPHNLTTGQVVKINVPVTYGMVQLNNLTSIITYISTTMFSLQYVQVPFTLNVDSTSYTPFTIPTNPQFTAEVIPIGAGPSFVTQPLPLVQKNVAYTQLDDAFTNNSTQEIPY